MIELTV